MRLTRISLAQSFAHCSQAVGGGCVWGVGEGGGGGEAGGEGNRHGGDTLCCSLLGLSGLRTQLCSCRCLGIRTSVARVGPLLVAPWLSL